MQSYASCVKIENAMIEIEGVRKAFGKKTILKDVNLTVRPGEQVAVIGKNGSGKTTLMQIVAGLLSPDGGSVRFFSKDAGRDTKLFAKYCGYLPQENPLIGELSVQDNISLWSGKRGRPSEELVRMFDLADILRTPVEKLSGGMKRRVGIACTIVNFPPVLLMDEPTAALDIYYQKEIRDWMKEYRKSNGILLLATHDREEMRESSRVVLLEDGVLKDAQTKE